MQSNENKIERKKKQMKGWKLQMIPMQCNFNEWKRERKDEEKLLYCNLDSYRLLNVSNDVLTFPIFTSILLNGCHIIIVSALALIGLREYIYMSFAHWPISLPPYNWFVAIDRALNPWFLNNAKPKTWNELFSISFRSLSFPLVESNLNSALDATEWHIACARAHT